MDTVAAGSYDRFLFGFQCSTSGRTEVKFPYSTQIDLLLQKVKADSQEQYMNEFQIIQSSLAICQRADISGRLFGKQRLRFSLCLRHTGEVGKELHIPSPQGM